MSEISLLPRARYEGYELRFSYTSELYYDVRIHDTFKGFSVDFVRMPFPVPKEKEYVDRLYEQHWDEPEAFGIFEEDGTLVAVLEVSPDLWNNRLRVTNLWVSDDRRRQGLGRKLVNHAKELAGIQRRRALVLETQTCNANAIDFYLSQGFTISGFDAFAYSNEDIERKEVRLELSFKTPRARGG